MVLAQELMTSPDSTADNGRALFDQGLVPLTIGVTGHRDLVPSEIPRIEARVRGLFEYLRARFPDRPLQILSPLAEGADRLVARVARDLGVRLAVPLPLPQSIYMEDFVGEASHREFLDLLGGAAAVYELPTAPGSDPQRWAERAEDRNRQYAAAGIFLCAHSHLLLALWDGKPSADLGGTAQVIGFHHHDVMPGYSPSTGLNRQTLVADDSDLVYHVVVSRDRIDGQPIEGLLPLSASWLTADEAEPRSSELPERFARVFERTSRFNRDVRQFQDRIASEGYSLIAAEAREFITPDMRYIDSLFCAADWLAIYFQQRTLAALRLTHACAFIMGLLFVTYSNVQARGYFMLGFFCCLAGGFAVHLLASRGRWHSQYLEYRALAESLRVQFYWAVAGVTSDVSTKFAHDNFLQKQDSDLAWIPNVMRVAGVGCDVKPNLDPRGLEFVLGQWVGADTRGGQLRYFRRKINDYAEHARTLDWFGRLIGVAAMVILVLTLLVSSADARNWLFAILGWALLLFGLRESYSHKTAEKELIKQYQFMYSIFSKAHRRIQAAKDDQERRGVLRILGESALDEHAEWILRHRDRPLNSGGLWRMET
jgi:hypothetical protein